MNILIEDANTQEYLASNNLWTKNAAEGKSFIARAEAFEVAEQEPIKQFNIVCYFPQTKQLINLDHGKGKGISETSPA